MAVMGASTYGPAGVQTVDSVDQWVPLLSLDSADLPDQGAAKEYVFVVWFDFGNFNTLNNPGIVTATAEVTFGDQNAPTPSERDVARSLLIYPPLSIGTVPGRTIPCFHVYGRTSAQRGTWNTTTRDFTVWGRIASNGDPVLSVAGASFTVANIGIMAFSLDNLTSTTMIHDRYTPGVPQQGNGSTPAAYQTTSAPWNAGEGTWLAMFSASHAPMPFSTRAQVNADRLINYIVDTPPSTGIERLTAYGETGTNGRHGMAERLPAGWPQTIWGTQALYFEGGFRVIEDPVTTAEFGISLVAPGATSGVLSGALVQWEVFALRVDADGGAGLGSFEYVQKNAGATPSATVVDDIFNGVGVAFGSETKEEKNFGSGTKTRQTELHVQVAPFADGLSSNQSWQMRVEEPGGNGNLYNQSIPFIESIRLGDSPMFRAGGLIPPGAGPAGIDYSAFLIQNTSEGQFGALAKPAESFLAFAFHWENDPQNVTQTVPTVPAAVSIVPGRESPNVSALNALPNGAGGDQLLPDIDYELEAEQTRHDFRTDDLTRLTWPAFMTTRRRFLLRWNGLSQADRDTLLAFLAAQGDRIWKLALPEDPSTYLAVVQTEHPRTQDAGVNHSVNVRVVELIFTS